MGLAAYIKTAWADRVVQYPRRYKDQNNTQYTFTPDEGTITNTGTPLNATRLNNMEAGIEAVTNEVIAYETNNAKQLQEQSILYWMGAI